MKKVGVLLVIAAMVIGYISDNYISSIWFESFIVLALCFWLIGIYLLTLDNNCPKKGSLPKKCICNDIGKHSPGGRCEADHSVKSNKFILSGKANYEFRFWHFDKKESSEEFKVFNKLSFTCQNALIVDWFREVHDLHSYVERYDDGSFDYVITSDLFKEVFDYNDGPFETFLDAQNKSIVTMVSKIYDNPATTKKSFGTTLHGRIYRPEFPKDRT